MRRSAQAGFSLVELMVAMVITLIVTGAIFGLLSGGQSSFKVQPERTDRQQNIRIAMDMISREVAAAGVGMPNFVQTFTPGLDACGACPGGGAVMGPYGARTDEIEIVTNTAAFDNEGVCDGTNTTIPKVTRKTAVFPPTSGVIAVMTDDTWKVRTVAGSAAAGVAGACAGTNHRDLTLSADACSAPAGAPPAFQLGNATGGCTIKEISFASVVRYRIRNGADGVPSLERVVNGGAGQVLARGIEDLQVQYVQSDPASPCILAAPCNAAPAVTTPDFKTLITQVRITLSARSTAPGRPIQGATTSASGPDAIRASLSSEVSPRQALWALTKEKPQPIPPRWN